MSESAVLERILKNPKKNQHSIEFAVVSDADLQQLTNACNKDSRFVTRSSHELIQSLQNPKYVVRLKALIAIDHLFYRFRLFRQMVSSNIARLSESAGFARHSRYESGEPMHLARPYKERVKQCIEMWDLKFSRECPQVRATKRFYVESLRLEMPNIAAKARDFDLDQKRKNAEANIRLLSKCELVMQENSMSRLEEISSSIESLNNLFSLVSRFGSSFRESLTSAKETSNDGNVRKRPRDMIDLYESDEEPDEINGAGNHDDQTEKQVSNMEDTAVKNSLEDDGDVEWEDEVRSALSPVKTSPFQQKVRGNHGFRLEEGFGIGVNSHETSKASTESRTFKHVTDAGSLPHALSIPLPTSANEVEKEDNKIIIQSIREIAKHLESHAIPLLRARMQTLSKSSRILDEYDQTSNLDRDRNRKSLHVKKSSSSADVIVSDSASYKILDRMKYRRREVDTALHDTKKVYLEVMNMVNNRCKTFLSE
jgi:hypothetical protein